MLKLSEIQSLISQLDKINILLFLMLLVQFSSSYLRL